MKTSISKERKIFIERLGYFRTKANLSARELSLRMGKSLPILQNTKMATLICQLRNFCLRLTFVAQRVKNFLLTRQ